MCEPTHVYPVSIPSAPGNSVSVARLPSHIEAPSANTLWTRSDAPWAGLALWSVSADPPHDVTRSSPGYHLRLSPWGRNLDQSCAHVHSIYDDDPQDDRTRRQDSPENDPQDDLTPTSGQFSAQYAEQSEPANRNDPSGGFGSNFAGQLPGL